jgi:hypothetical protein
MAVISLTLWPLDTQEETPGSHLINKQKVLVRIILPTFPMAMVAIVTLVKDCM